MRKLPNMLIAQALGARRRAIKKPAGGARLHGPIARKKCQLEGGRAVNSQRPRSCFSTTMEAKPSGTLPFLAWNWRIAALVLTPRRPSGSPTS